MWKAERTLKKREGNRANGVVPSLQRREGKFRVPRAWHSRDSLRDQKGLVRLTSVRPGAKSKNAIGATVRMKLPRTFRETAGLRPQILITLPFSVLEELEIECRWTGVVQVF